MEHGKKHEEHNTRNNMKNILKNAENAEKLLKLTSDTMIILDKNGICIDITIYNVDLWFLKEEFLLGKNMFDLLP